MTASKQQIRWTFVRSICGIVLGGIFLIAPPAFGELLESGGDPNAMADWQGTKDFLSEWGFLDVDILYAVYEPGNFNKSFSGQDPSDGSQYVYAYQLLNSGDSFDSINILTVGLDTDTKVANIGEFDDPVLPSGIESDSYFSGSPPQSAVWTYLAELDGFIDPSEKSKILIYNSPYGPQWLPSTVGGNIEMGEVSGGLPSPKDVPEPGTMLCLALACGFFLFIRSLQDRVFK